jgi:hypothetical protein
MAISGGLGRSLINRSEVALSLGEQQLFVVPTLDPTGVVTAGHYADAIQSGFPLLISNGDIMPAAS